MRIITAVGTALQQLFGAIAEEVGQTSGVIVRKRKFTGLSLARTFVLGFLRNPEASDEELARIAVYLNALSTSVKPRRQIQVLRDVPDNRILECAVAGRAEAIVTGDKAVLALRSHAGIRILSLRNYLSE